MRFQTQPALCTGSTADTSDTLRPVLPHSATAFPGSAHQANRAAQATTRTTSSSDVCPNHVAAQVHPSPAMAAAGHSPRRCAARHTHTHTAVRVCGVHHGPAASCPSPGCNLRHGTAAQPSPSTQVEPAHECDGGAETACTGQGWDVPAVSTGWVNAPGCAQTPARLSRARGACCGSLGTGDICSGPQQGAPRWGQQGAKLEGKQTKWRAAA